jgi:purine-cytosine permease-like protein
MVLSRAAFGVRGNRALSLTVGWEIGLVVLGTLAATTVLDRLGIGSGTGVKAAVLLVIASVTVAAGVAGFDAVMRLQRLITIVAGALTVAFVALTASDIDWSAATAPPSGSVQSLIGVAVLTAAGFGLGWVNVAADYSEPDASELVRSCPEGMTRTHTDVSERRSYGSRHA